MNTNGFKIGDIVCINPYGECPTHYCQIESFENIENLMVSARGKWYSKRGNCIAGTGFDVNYIKQSFQEHLDEAIKAYRNRND